MRLLLLGTTGYHPSERRHTACMMLPEIGVVLDAGTAMFRVRQHLATPTLDIFLTHAHLDHVVGLTYLFGTLYGKSIDAIRVHGDPAKLAAIREHLFHPVLFPVMPPIRWTPLLGPVPVGQGGTLRAFPVKHPGDAYGYRIDWPGRSLAYVTDTTAVLEAPYVDDIRGVDLLIHECYFSDGAGELAAMTGHSCLTPVLQVAAEARVGRLVLVHINPIADGQDAVDLAAARRRFPNTEIGTDGTEIVF